MFVFAVTQVTTLLGRQLTLAGFAQAMLVLSLMWWAWSAFVWVANAFPVVGTMVVLFLGGALPGWGLAACVAALLGALCAFESAAFPPMAKPSPSIR